ncbi:decaprenyl-phosphate phosphoribosyltransferase [Cellulomonas fengjieae]|uniref:Decaprenyl-phosphate phosphoribosyltransferase n=1 Tax=Cellulomonas fengjieae TaxID=2819978 RepID=A0ABS3SDK3_9CELL|nr:decaprenyl-phosphate phosphoribosyltransferase [Cellulomonas fengjieae]MBO3083832.1 decaprenyl-phosphate phosphoribosyltransferase [Cellulomonas fengjieae]MBO3101419.1 decaprenyl-phosphate phosphoribosyltransferase [Cellulomonas fengjieae]QVI64882.1 decaprenyl-phosphate phosphoribosyltransferase [Cellulomonas fengjieae]
MPPLLRAARPRQWVKNVLVAAGPLAAGTIADADTVVAVLVAFVTFCAASSGIYMINDVLDREADRAHPVKKFRPIASGAVSVRLAVIVGVLLLLGAPAAAALLGYGVLAVVLAVYIVLQLSYCLWFKHQAVIDLAIVSSGFLLRAVAGGVAASVELSPWFLLVAAFGSLFMVAGKRYSEVHLVGEGEASTRRSLELYSASYLRFVWSIAGAATLTFYSLWAFSLERTNDLLPQLSVVPFVVALLRYAVDIDRGAAGEPESIVLGDRTLQVLGVAWLAIFTASAALG